MNLGNLSRLSNARSRSISAENVYGEKGKGAMAEVSTTPQPEVARIGQHWVEKSPSHAARELGRGWKVRPWTRVHGQTTVTLADVDGPGAIQHFWCTVNDKFFRSLILRIYWDGAENPSVEVPLGDFFCNGWNTRVDVRALPINVNPKGGLNSYFPMPFRKHVRMTLENRGLEDCELYYVINYALTDVPEDEAYFHAQFRRTNPLPYKQEYVILDGVAGKGHYVGVYMAWQQNSQGWWGEGEFKVFLDGDHEFPTFCGTGTEDYFGGAWCFHANYSAPFLGYPLGESDGRPGNRHGLYRFHVMDPIRFEKDIRIQIQALGWRSNGRLFPLQDDISSVAYWYQTHPAKPFPELPSQDALEVV